MKVKFLSKNGTEMTLTGEKELVIPLLSAIYDLGVTDTKEFGEAIKDMKYYEDDNDFYTIKYCIEQLYAEYMYKDISEKCSCRYDYPNYLCACKGW